MSQAALVNGSRGRNIKETDRRFIRVLIGAHRRLLGASSSRLLGRMGGHPLLILTTSGRRTGQPYSTPVIGIASGPDWLVVASNGGAATQPLWVRNIEPGPGGASLGFAFPLSARTCAGEPVVPLNHCDVGRRGSLDRIHTTPAVTAAAAPSGRQAPASRAQHR